MSRSAEDLILVGMETATPMETVMLLLGAAGSRSISEPITAFWMDWGHLERPLAVGVGHQDDELVPSVSGHKVAGAVEGLLENPTHQPQALVPGLVAEVVVDRLEIIHIQDKDAQGPDLAAGSFPLCGDHLIEIAAVADSGKGGR